MKSPAWRGFFYGYRRRAARPTNAARSIQRISNAPPPLLSAGLLLPPETLIVPETRLSVSLVSASADDTVPL